MDAKTLSAVMYNRLAYSRYKQLAPHLNDALIEADCTTVKRVAMFVAQIGEESGSLEWTEELASGEEYEGRVDLGNTEPGDGPRFKGRSFIQITGRTNYTNLSRWAHEKGYVPTVDYFVVHPHRLAHDAYAFLGPVWYWKVARPGLNRLADEGDIYDATRAVNGGTNGLADRTNRWNNALRYGDKLLPEDSLNMHSLRKLVIDGLRAYHTGEDHGFWTHKRFPNLVDGKGGVEGHFKRHNDRINSLEKKVH